MLKKILVIIKIIVSLILQPTDRHKFRLHSPVSGAAGAGGRVCCEERAGASSGRNRNWQNI